MGKSVAITADFRRVRDLPRRVVSEEVADEWARHLTPLLRCRGSNVELRQWQALALGEAIDSPPNQGVLLGYPVGTGKTLIAELLPVVTGARRAVILTDGSGLRDKTYSDRGAFVGRWKLANPPPRVLTYQELTSEKNENLLFDIQPDRMILDEFDALANAGASAASRIDRYVRATDIPVDAMSGSPLRFSLMEIWHILGWVLKDSSPMPHDEDEARTWAEALDEQHGRVWRGNRDPGPLGPNVDAARAWFGKRLRETPGAIFLDGDSCNAEFTIEIRCAKESATIDKHFAHLARRGENPRGIPCADPLARLRGEAQTGCGYCQYWDPAPPKDWMLARRVFARFSRAAIDRSKRTSHPLDTEKQVRRRYEDRPEVADWEEIAPTFTPNTAVEWFCDSTIETIEEWLDESPEPGAIWCGSVEFAERLSQRTGLAYYGRKGQSANGVGLHDAPTDQSLITSWHANKRGFNLQAWGRALIVYPPESGKYLEQTYGRHHRSGREDPVHVTLLATSGSILDAFEKALASEAPFGQVIVGMTQKILRADIRRVEPTVTKSNRYRWARKR